MSETLFGQVVVGPPGSGKTTYVKIVSEYFTQDNSSDRLPIVINLDPANDILPYKCDINIFDLITLEDAMEEMSLGPNGGIIFCLEYINKGENITWLAQEICKCYIAKKSRSISNNIKDKGNIIPYLLIDLPGQVEIYTHSDVVQSILGNLVLALQENSLNLRLSCVNLVDSFHCISPNRFLSVILLSLQSMLRLELPHINVLTKYDLIIERYNSIYGERDTNSHASKQKSNSEEKAIEVIESPGLNNDIALNYVTMDSNLSFLIDLLPDEVREMVHDVNIDLLTKDQSLPITSKLQIRLSKMNARISDVVSDYGLIAFQTLNILDVKSLEKTLQIIDNATGFHSSS